ncbi:coiled-coil domain-containing protein 15 isoform X1 [Grus americana]|uniref:coiled-coil domain-containing protein 15 isoform X1 n=1 Tax=Grus americana TaxID=9117 RepID=UPI002408748E|nr:coiled-coil domain-containing protein 15 isoform X1 [Grus americana]
MVPPLKEQPRGGREHPGGHQARPLWQSWRVLAERNQSVAPVGVWVEGAPGEPEESVAFASAFRVEEELKEQQREKAASLSRFQGEVKRRVNQQVRMRRKQQLQKSCEAAERESSVAAQYSDSALHLTPRKNTCLFRSHPAPAIGDAGARTVPAQWQGAQCEPFQQQATELSKTVRQVRRKLASCKTVPEGAGPPELPGGVWRREKPESCKTGTAPAEDEGEELLLAGHHDLPAELQGQAERDDDFYIKIEFEKVCDGLVKDSSLPAPPQRLHADYRAPLVLWAGADQEETKKQRQHEYLRYRRLFMNVEREQVKEQQRQKERQRRIAEIKSKKENQRRVEERKMQELAGQQEPPPGEGAWEPLAQLKLEERRVKKVKDKQQRNKEYVRYIEALRAQMREKIKLYHIDLPLLCSCGSDFWDSHPDTCANNCVFYKNHTAYSQALQSVLASCVSADRSPSARPPLRGLAALCARSGKHL